MADTENSVTSKQFSPTILILCICLICLILLLIFLYKKLNKEADGQYTVRRMVYKKGGVRDQMRGAALALGSAVGVRLWPHSITDEDGEEMQEVQIEEKEVEEGQIEDGGSQESHSERDDQEEKEDNVAQCGKTKGQGDDTDDNSSLESSEAKRDVGEKQEEKEERVGDEEGKGEASGGAGLLINLKQFSGSATWSEDEGGMVKGCDITAL